MVSSAPFNSRQVCRPGSPQARALHLCEFERQLQSAGNSGPCCVPEAVRADLCESITGMAVFCVPFGVG